MLNDWIELNLPFGPVDSIERKEIDKMLFTENGERINLKDEQGEQLVRKYSEKYNELLKNNKLHGDSASRRGIIRPGVQIEIDGRKLLIGDINPLGGECDDCSSIRAESIIVRYRVVADEL